MFTGQLTCRCGQCDGGYVDLHQLIALDEYDSYLPGYNSKVYSGCRCHEWNIHEGGSIGSFHEKHKATDFYTEGLSPQDMVPVAEMVKVWFNGGIGVYIYDKEAPGWIDKYKERTGFIHTDIRGWKARWFYINGIKQSYKVMVGANIFTL